MSGYVSIRQHPSEYAGAESLAALLGQCTALPHLILSYNDIGPVGAASFAGVLAQCTALAHLDLYGNLSGKAGADSLAGVMGQCTVLAHLDLGSNAIEGVGEWMLRASWCGQASGLVLYAPCTFSRCHVFSRKATRKSDMLCTCSAVAFGLALSLSRKEVMNTRHDLYLIASLWVVALLCIYSQYQSIRRRGIYLKNT